jgi:hypothetical protein
MDKSALLSVVVLFPTSLTMVLLGTVWDETTSGRMAVTVCHSSCGGS